MDRITSKRDGVVGKRALGLATLTASAVVIGGAVILPAGAASATTMPDSGVTKTLEQKGKDKHKGKGKKDKKKDKKKYCWDKKYYKDHFKEDKDEKYSCWWK